MKTKTQMIVYLALLIVYSLMVFLVSTSGMNQAPGAAPSGGQITWQMGLAASAAVLAGYGLLGLLGYALARKLGLPGIFRPAAGTRGLFWLPLAIGLGAGLALAAIDQAIAALTGTAGFTHPSFPLSIYASLSAGIGEEILFRLFVFSLWAFLLSLLLRRWKLSNLALWIANVIAALAFAAGHLPAAMVLTGAASPSELPAYLLVELVLLNGVMGILAGQRFMKDGLVAAAGVHFWADIIWHVVFPLAISYGIGFAAA